MEVLRKGKEKIREKKRVMSNVLSRVFRLFQRQRESPDIQPSVNVGK